MKVLDVGAQGIIIPNVHSVAQVDEIVSYAKYQPIGKRGFAASRKDGWGFDAPDGVAAKMAYFNENTLVIPQCETRGRARRCRADRGASRRRRHFHRPV